VEKGGGRPGCGRDHGAAMARYGNPGHIRSDNGPEFIAHPIRDLLEKEQIGGVYIAPGALW
jgi:hypothetical protein